MGEMWQFPNVARGVGLGVGKINLWHIIRRGVGDEGPKAQGRQLGMQDCSAEKRGLWKEELGDYVIEMLTEVIGMEELI